MGPDYEKRGYNSPEQMLEAFFQRADNMHAINNGRYDLHFDYSYLQTLPSIPFIEKAPLPLELDQSPRQWNLITLKRCVVTKEEFRYYGSIQSILERKDFPTQPPSDGTLIISWFDESTMCAYYELCKVQDKGEMMEYMLKAFQGEREDGEESERSIYFE